MVPKMAIVVIGRLKISHESMNVTATLPKINIFPWGFLTKEEKSLNGFLPTIHNPKIQMIVQTIRSTTKRPVKKAKVFGTWKLASL